MKKRNIILVGIDEVRFDHLSCYGYKRIKTENIDTVAEEGVLLETAITAASLTPMCVASILCGVLRTNILYEEECIILKLRRWLRY
jgi:arylsulfatase A-like enzyme